MGCFTANHKSVILNGQLMSETCVNGICYYLYGVGSIQYEYKENIIQFQCEGQEAIEYNADEVAGYNCYNNTVILRQ